MLCHVERNLFGPTGYVEPLVRRTLARHLYLPSFKKALPDQELELVLNIEEMQSNRITELVRQDFDDLVSENG